MPGPARRYLCLYSWLKWPPGFWGASSCSAHNSPALTAPLGALLGPSAEPAGLAQRGAQRVLSGQRCASNARRPQDGPGEGVGTSRRHVSAAEEKVTMPQRAERRDRGLSHSLVRRTPPSRGPQSRWLEHVSERSRNSASRTRLCGQAKIPDAKCCRPPVAALSGLRAFSPQSVNTQPQAPGGQC